MDTRLDVAFLPHHSISATSCRTHTFSSYLLFPHWFKKPIVSQRYFLLRCFAGKRMIVLEVLIPESNRRHRSEGGELSLPHATVTGE